MFLSFATMVHHQFSSDNAFSPEQKARGSNLGPVLSDFRFDRHRCDISLKGAVLSRLNDAEMDLAGS